MKLAWLILSRREFLQGTGLMLLPHHRPWHKPRFQAGSPMGMLLSLTYS